MRTSHFLCACLMVFSGISSSYLYMHLKFDGSDLLRKRLERSLREKEQLELKQELTEFQFLDFKQHVATLIPEKLKDDDSREENYPLRNLASVVKTHDSKHLKFEMASSMFERAKEAFRTRAYTEAAAEFENLIETYPGSIYVVESYFLLSESRYQAQELDKSVDAIQVLISQFPESELTGFALLRLGKIFEKQERLEDAAEVYKAVLKAFSHIDIREQAQVSLKSVEL